MTPNLPYSPRTFSDALGTPLSYAPIVESVSYVRPVEQIYPLRVPSHEMSYVEYTQMYDYAYRNYYSCGLNYSPLKPTVSEKVFKYEAQTEYEDISMKDIPETYEEVPLNLICTKRLESKPIEDLVRHTDLPLDLSTKS